MKDLIDNGNRRICRVLMSNQLYDFSFKSEKIYPPISDISKYHHFHINPKAKVTGYLLHHNYTDRQSLLELSPLSREILFSLSAVETSRLGNPMELKVLWNKEIFHVASRKRSSRKSFQTLTSTGDYPRETPAEVQRDLQQMWARFVPSDIPRFETMAPITDVVIERDDQEDDDESTSEVDSQIEKPSGSQAKNTTSAHEQEIIAAIGTVTATKI